MSDHMRCRHCGAVNFIDDSFCTSCREYLPLTVRDVVALGPPPREVQEAFIAWWCGSDADVEYEPTSGASNG